MPDRHHAAVVASRRVTGAVVLAKRQTLSRSVGGMDLPPASAQSAA